MILLLYIIILLLYIIIVFNTLPSIYISQVKGGALSVMVIIAGNVIGNLNSNLG